MTDSARIRELKLVKLFAVFNERDAERRYLWQQNLPNAELMHFPDSNHGSQFQFTDQFNRYATAFLDR